MTDHKGATWYVVQTHPHAEAKAAEHLRRQGFEVYLPRYQKQRRHARRVETIAAALFPRYLFVAFDMAIDSWHCIRSTLGVARLVGGENGPAVISAAIIDDIRRREDKTGLVPVQSPPLFQKGERVQLTDGVLSTYSGVFDGMTEKDRVAVLLDMLGRRVRVVINWSSVAAA